MRLLLLGVALFAATSSRARDLPVPPDKGWQHAKTGLVLMSSLGGEQRTRLADAGQDELDVTAQYGGGPSDARSITVYLFHPGLDDVALWFDRVDTQIHARDVYGGVTASTAAPVAFQHPGGTTADSLRMIYSANAGAYRTTAAAMMPLGEWLVAIRISSTTDDAATLSARLDAVIAGISFPKNQTAADAVSPIAACTTHLSYRHAKLVKPDVGEALMGAIEGTVEKEESTKAQPTARLPFCRDGTATPAFAVYRHDDATQLYWIGLGDAGQAAVVGGGLGALLGTGGVAVRFLNLGATDVYPSFDRLPEPEQVVDLLSHGTPISRSSGKTITIGVSP